MNIRIFPNCNNAPKMGAVIDLTVALAGKDYAAVESLVRDDFTWSTVGDTSITKFEQLKNELTQRPSVAEIEVTNGMSHGAAAMCEGTMEFTDGDKLFFCAVAQFVNTAKDARIKALHMYYVK